MAKQKYIVLHPIGRGDVIEHKAGAEIEFDPENANTQRLLKAKAIARPQDVAPKRSAPSDDGEKVKAAEAKAADAQAEAKELQEQLTKAQEAEKAAEAKVAELQKELEDAKKAASKGGK